mmetsp:Transcript_1895/g.5985  ORF Transcript_1895/g.5985 Transcript_1895/m.5985 type:complete len:753 (+) Transcript_1895:276-2534(+)
MASPPTPPGSILSARSNRWPIRSSLVRRYLMLFGLGATCDGTRSTMRSPNPASPENFFGLFDMRRMSRMPRSARICAPVPYSRESAGKPSCKFASSVSTPCSCSAYACIFAPRPMPRPSCPRRYSKTPQPSSSIACSAFSSCGPQSQRRDPNTSPVQHSECTRTSGAVAPAGCDEKGRRSVGAMPAPPPELPTVRKTGRFLTRAMCSWPSTSDRYVCAMNSPCLVGMVTGGPHRSTSFCCWRCRATRSAVDACGSPHRAVASRSAARPDTRIVACRPRGGRPARRASSTTASVPPARRRTPPSLPRWMGMAPEQERYWCEAPPSPLLLLLPSPPSSSPALAAAANAAPPQQQPAATVSHGRLFRYYGRASAAQASSSATASADAAAGEAPSTVETGLPSVNLRLPGLEPPTPVGGARRKTSFVTAAVQAVGPSVVRIDTERLVDRPALEGYLFPDRGGEGDGQRRESGQGSGVILSEDGLIMTNAHVVKNAAKVTVTLIDGRTFDGLVRGTDEFMDLAAIRIKPSGKPLPTAPLGRSDELQVGDWAIAIGNAVGLDSTVTLGIISSLSRSAAEVGIPNKKVNFIQTDAAINPGNSGGPLVDSASRVVGINTAIIQGAQNLSFSVPSATAQWVVSELLAHGHVRRSFLGLGCQLFPVSRLFQRAHLFDPPTAVQAVNVVPAGPAARAGVRQGDVLLAIDGNPLRSVDEIHRLLPTPGKRIRLRLVRPSDARNPNGEGRISTVELTTEARPHGT